MRNEEASKAAGEALKEGKPEGSKDMLGTLAKKVQEGLEELPACSQRVNIRKI